MVSSYYPVFAGQNPEIEVKSLTENFQMKVAHHFSSEFVEYYVLKDANGNHVDVMSHNMIKEQGFFGMRVNVDDFDAMVDLLKSQGYEFSFGPFDFPASTLAVMENPNNPAAHRFVISHHKKG